MTDEPWQPALVYTPRGIGRCGRPPTSGDREALAALLGGRRAASSRRSARRRRRPTSRERLGASAAGVAST